MLIAQPMTSSISRRGCSNSSHSVVFADTTEKARQLCQEEMAYPKSWNLIPHKFSDKFAKFRGF
jgi:hypothetical protein